MSSTNRGAKRESADFYPTPSNAIDCIFREIDWSKIHSFLERCAGDRRIIRAIENTAGLSPRPEHIEWCEIREGRDYFHTSWPNRFDLIVTNPPFSSAMAFCDKALTDSVNVAMLLRLGFLGSKKRHAWWAAHPPARLFALSQRPSFTGKGTDSSDYGWICWGDAFKRPPGIYSVM